MAAMAAEILARPEVGDMAGLRQGDGDVLWLLVPVEDADGLFVVQVDAADTEGCVFEDGGFTCRGQEFFEHSLEGWRELREIVACEDEPARGVDDGGSEFEIGF